MIVNKKEVFTIPSFLLFMLLVIHTFVTEFIEFYGTFYSIGQKIPPSAI